jgi:hypothetical protein
VTGPDVAVTFLPARSDFPVAIAAIYRSIPSWLKWYFSVFPALSAYNREHLAWLAVTVATTSIALLLPGLTARRATLGLIGIATRLEELLFFRAEDELGAAIGTLERLVLKSHG